MGIVTLDSPDEGGGHACSGERDVLEAAKRKDEPEVALLPTFAPVRVETL